MNLSSEEIKGGNDAAEQVEIDDSPTALTTAPIRGYTALSSKEIVEVIDTVAPVLPESPLQPSPQTRVKTNEAQKSTANSYGGLGRGKGYGGLGGRSSLLQQRLRAGNIKHFDSGEHFRQQAEKTREEQSQRVVRLSRSSRLETRKPSPPADGRLFLPSSVVVSSNEFVPDVNRAK